MRRSTMARGLAVLGLVLLATAGAGAARTAPAEVLLLGVFHFANPGLDLVRSEVTDVRSEENQRYLEALTDRIAALRPTVVLLEYEAEDDEAINARYRAWRAGEAELGVGEIDQLGFRIAAKAGQDRVHGFDERTVGWDAQPLFDRLEDLPRRKAELDATIEALGEHTSELHRTRELDEILRLMNGEAYDRRNRGLYVATNDIGAGAGFEGARASATWWHRNFRMYALLQARAAPGERVVAIAGQGHTAVLRRFLADDADRVAVDPLDLL